MARLIFVLGHPGTRIRATSVTVDKDRYIYRVAAPGTSEELKVIIEKE